MNKISKKMLTVCFGLTLLLVASSAGAANPYNLAPGARGKLCLSCHEAFSEVMGKKYIHTPLAEGDCSSCHNPHAADHGQLLAEDATRICISCHDALIPVVARSAHQAVRDGDCAACHDPHASDNPMNLLEPSNTLCVSCHQELGERIAGNRVPHTPVDDDCMTCHTPHASADNPALLKATASQLCLDCHESDQKTFKNQHVGYPVEQANCASCHDPHGSNTTGMLYDNVHEPLTKRMCSQCHESPTATEPFATKKNGFELCQGCHYDLVNDTFNQELIHWAVVDGKGCLNCHSPHASSESALLKASMKQTCNSCHADTIARQSRSLTKHQPVDDGECSTCHAPHSSNNAFLMTEDSSIDLCGQCHDWQTHSTHPIGAEISDPRNPNLTLDCLSCHRSHGTEYKHFIYTETINDLCVQCHTRFRR